MDKLDEQASELALRMRLSVDEAARAVQRAAGSGDFPVGATMADLDRLLRSRPPQGAQTRVNTLADEVVGQRAGGVGPGGGDDSDATWGSFANRARLRREREFLTLDKALAALNVATRDFAVLMGHAESERRAWYPEVAAAFRRVRSALPADQNAPLAVALDSARGALGTLVGALPRAGARGVGARCVACGARGAAWVHPQTSAAACSLACAARGRMMGGRATNRPPLAAGPATAGGRGGGHEPGKGCK